ncbi:MAG TPA: hypothetical protein PK588_08630 [Paludibacteraceae bacterium]|nr:hypothetical protein [Paludibacteraceae bacterium]
MRKPGDIEMIFGNPAKLTNPIGQARLIKKLADYPGFEEWSVEFLDSEGHCYNVMLKCENNGTTSNKGNE